MKIIVSELRNDDHDVQILEALSYGSPSDSGRENIIQLLDDFEHEGPNGTYQCLVFELLGPSVLSEAEERNERALIDRPFLAFWTLVSGLLFSILCFMISLFNKLDCQ